MLSFAPDGAVSTLGFSPELDRVLVGCADGTAWIWSVEPGERLLQLGEGLGAGSMVRSVACQDLLARLA